MTKYLDYVNIKQGTKSEFRYSNGNTLPLVQRPFGMAHVAVQTKAAMPGGMTPMQNILRGSE